MVLQKPIKYIFLHVSLLIVTFCQASPQEKVGRDTIIPAPRVIEATSDIFTLTAKSYIVADTDNPQLTATAHYLAEHLSVATGFPLPIKATSSFSFHSSIELLLDGSLSSLGREGYQLTIKKRKVVIAANDPAGIFMGIQTLRQLLPPEIESSHVVHTAWTIPTAVITDFPQYEHRGVMLDVARHFFSVHDVKQFIDYLALYKINVLHLHLTDDQGWRIEIKSWPNLTKIGGSSEVGGGKGGFYTQDQYREIVEYAASRYIVVIPEIDVPGHTNAALASYAALNKSGKAPKHYTGMKVGFSTLATRNELTYTFLDDVIRELALLTPGPYIHIGGDESLVTKKSDYIYCINRVNTIVRRYGKIVVGWNEVAKATVKKGSVVQYWSNRKETVKAARLGAKVVLSPASYTYMDMKYHSKIKQGLRWAGYIEVDKAYQWNLEELITDLPKDSIAGIEAPLWTEKVETLDDIEFMVFPRMPGYAELGWSKKELCSWESYRYRLATHERRWQLMKINYYRSPKVPWRAR